MLKCIHNIILYDKFIILFIHNIVVLQGSSYSFGGSPYNVALRRVAAQSSLFSWENSPSKVIDGNRNSNYNYGGSCSSTAFNTNPWWRVDLLDLYRVTAVTITNRGDCCPKRLDGAEIRIGNSLENNGINNPRCVVIHHIPAGETYTFQCNEMEGQYVVVVIPGQNKILTLCEVEVFATVKPPDNVALRRVAAQSSLFSWENSPSKVIDGNRNSNYNYGGSCSSTAFNTNPWWRVDLLDLYRVTAVTITNRGDCCPKRLDGAEIRIGNSLENNGINNPRCVVIHHIPAGETYTFQCNEMEGQYVVVVIPGQNKILTLCEVEVFMRRRVDPHRQVTTRSILYRLLSFLQQTGIEDIVLLSELGSSISENTFIF
uniref:Fucolectin tachylectin-4 pentraxin-1 domain-containing protein n=1 Tax=Oncorhynchus mykiss TaxID=8022 RepID=A0A8C7PW73_ONCMY